MASNTSFQDVKKAVYKIPLWQALIGVAVAAAYLLTSGSEAGLAAAVGTLISVLGSLVFAWVVFGRPSAPVQENDPGVIGRMLKGEILKLAAVAMMFIAVYKSHTLLALPLLIGFIATLFSFWVAMFTAFR